MKLLKLVCIPCLAILSSLTTGCVVGEFANYASHAGSGHFERLNKQRALERVAKDWCLSIRASQVVPVYPLDEDIQVGDVMIVNTPITELKKYWNSRGYLPIEHRFGRFQPKGYGNYYEGKAYGVDKESKLPAMWQSGRDPKAWLAEPGALPVPITEKNKEETDAAFIARKTKNDQLLLTTNWPLAPRAGFPSYTFRVRAGEGFNGALPLQGVPIMLGALGARSVTGSVTLTDVYTYGIDEASLRQDLESWVSRPENSKYLVNYAAQPSGQGNKKRYNYLRVITRVYLVRSVDVSLVNQDASAWKVSAGSPKGSAADKVVFQKQDSDLLQQLAVAIVDQKLSTETPNPETANLQAEAVKLTKERAAMKDAFGGFVVPGGTISVASASDRTIAMKESFARPIVIGYHGLDFAILEDGTLSSVPVSTFGRLDQGREPSYDVATYKFDDLNRVVLDWLDGNANHQAQMDAWLRQKQLNISRFEFTNEDKYKDFLKVFASDKKLR